MATDLGHLPPQDSTPARIRGQSRAVLAHPRPPELEKARHWQPGEAKQPKRPCHTLPSPPALPLARDPCRLPLDASYVPAAIEPSVLYHARLPLYHTLRFTSRAPLPFALPSNLSRRGFPFPAALFLASSCVACAGASSPPPHSSPARSHVRGLSKDERRASPGNPDRTLVPPYTRTVTVPTQGTSPFKTPLKRLAVPRLSRRNVPLILTAAEAAQIDACGELCTSALGVRLGIVKFSGCGERPSARPVPESGVLWLAVIWPWQRRRPPSDSSVSHGNYRFFCLGPENLHPGVPATFLHFLGWLLFSVTNCRPQIAAVLLCRRRSATRSRTHLVASLRPAKVRPAKTPKRDLGGRGLSKFSTQIGAGGSSVSA